MLFYFCFLLSIIVLAGRYNIAGHRIVPKQTGFWAACFIVLFFTVFRFDIGWDYNQYYSFIYPKLKTELVGQMEIVPRLIYYIADYFHAPLIVFTSFGVITYGFIFHTIIQHSHSKYESLIIYLATFYISSLSIMRQSAALAVLFYGFKFIKDKKLIKYIIICIIAFGFHKSAIVGLIVYPLYHIKYRTVLFCILSFFILYKIVLPLILSSFLQGYMRYFINQDEFPGGRWTRLFYVIIFCY